MELRQSDIKLYKRCPQAYYYKNVLDLVPRLNALPLQRGSMLHAALENYYLGKPWKPAIEKYRPFWDDLLDEEKEYYGGDLLGDCIKIMRGYTRLYGKEHGEEVLAVELNFHDTPVEILPGLFLKGQIDLISRDSRGTWITEHKSHRKIPSEDTRFINMQTVLYVIAAEKLGYSVDGIRWNYLRTKLPTVPRELVRGGISRAKDIDTDYYTYKKAIIDSGGDPKDYREELERVKSNEFYVRRYSPKNEQVTRAILQDINNVAPIMQRLADHPYRNLDPFTCKNCGYKVLCQAELLGLDTSFILKKDFVSGKEVKNNGHFDNEEEET